MTDIDSRIIGHLRYIASAVDGLREDMREVNDRLGFLESQCAIVCSRLDRLNARVERIERRLELAPG